MNIGRIQQEFLIAKQHFVLIELRSTVDQKVFVKAALQPTPQRSYVISLKFSDSYPNEMPKIFIDAPPITSAPHMYNTGNICYLHHSFWNPGKHDIAFVLWKAAKWLSKYEVWKITGKWPGAEIKH